MHKLNALVRRAREPPQIVWCFCSLADKVLSGAYACADFSLRTLVRDASSGNKGQVDVFIFRLSLIHHMGHVLLERLGPSPQMRKKYWVVFESRATCRANLTPYGAELKVDLSWRAGWPRSMISFFAWVEDIALKDDYYLQLRAATRRSKAAVGFIDLSLIHI